MTKATLKVEFIPGSDISDCFHEAIRISGILGCYVEFNFNGVTCVAKEKTSARIGASSYHDAIKKDNIKVATSY